MELSALSGRAEAVGRPRDRDGGPPLPAVWVLRGEEGGNDRMDGTLRMVFSWCDNVRRIDMRANRHAHTHARSTSALSMLLVEVSSFFLSVLSSPGDSLGSLSKTGV